MNNNFMMESVNPFFVNVSKMNVTSSNAERKTTPHIHEYCEIYVNITGNVSFVIEIAIDGILTIQTFPNQSLKAISQMVTGFFEKESNMYGFKKIMLKTDHASLFIYPTDTAKKIEEALLRLTEISAYIWEDSED